MDRRVLFAALVLFAGGATGVGVAVFAFVGVDGGTPQATVVWESPPVEGSDGTDIATVAIDNETRVIQPALIDGARVIRALDSGSSTAWSTAIGPDTDRSNAEATETSGLAVGTLDGDPVVAATTATQLVVLNATDGTERFAVDLGGPSGITPAVGDPNGDGSNIVVAVTTDGRVTAVDAAGERVFDAAVGETVTRRPLIVSPNPDPDGRSSGVAGGVAVSTAGTDPGTVTLFDQTGEPRWEATPAVTTVSWTAAATRRGPVIALGGSNGNLEVLEAADGSVRYEVGLQDRPVAVGDRDAGRVLVGGVGSVWAVSLLDGEVVWKQQYGGETRVNAPRVRDVIQDDTPESVVINRNGELLGVNRNGEPVVRGAIPPTVVYAGPSFADVDGDGTPEMIVGSENGSLRALSA